MLIILSFVESGVGILNKKKQLSPWNALVIILYHGQDVPVCGYLSGDNNNDHEGVWSENNHPAYLSSACSYQLQFHFATNVITIQREISYKIRSLHRLGGSIGK